MSILKKASVLCVSLFLTTGAFAGTKSTANDVMSFTITNENLNKGEIKIKQRPDPAAPYLVIGCNNESDDFDILIGNLDRKEFTSNVYNVTISFEKKSYKEQFVPIIKDDKFYLTKKTGHIKDNQLFVYQFLKNNKVILDFGKNVVFYFNAKSNSKLVDNMNVIVSHCGLKF